MERTTTLGKRGAAGLCSAALRAGSHFHARRLRTAPPQCCHDYPAPPSTHNRVQTVHVWQRIVELRRRCCFGEKHPHAEIQRRFSRFLGCIAAVGRKRVVFTSARLSPCSARRFRQQHTLVSLPDWCPSLAASGMQAFSVQASYKTKSAEQKEHAFFFGANEMLRQSP